MFSNQVFTLSTKTVIESPTGTRIPKASVLIRNVATGDEINTYADDNGVCNDLELDSGQYEITVSKEGYKTTTESVEIREDTEELAPIILKQENEEEIPEPTSNPHVYEQGTYGVWGKVTPPTGQSYLGWNPSGLTLKVFEAMHVGETPIRTLTVDAKGQYELLDLEPGDYVIKTEDHRDVPIPFGESYKVLYVREEKGVYQQDIEVYPKESEDIIRVELKWNRAESKLNAYLEGMIEGISLGCSYYTYSDFLCTQNVLERTGVLFAKTPEGQSDNDNPQSITMYFCKYQKFHYYVEEKNLREDYLQHSDVTVEVYRYHYDQPVQVYHMKTGQGNRWNVFEYDGASDGFHEINTLTQSTREVEEG